MIAVTLRQLLEQTFDPNVVIIRDLLHKGGKLFLYAKKKHYKSMLLFNGVYDLAEGTPLWTKFPIPNPQRVLVVEQEVGPYMTQQRFNKINEYRRGKHALDNITIISKKRQIKLDDPDGYKILSDEIGHHAPSVVVLDPLRKFHRKDENDSTTVTEVIDNMDRLVADHGVALIVAHHQGHDGQIFGSQHMRGSSVWGDEADTIINLSKPVKSGPDKHRVIRVEIEDIRHAAAPPPFNLTFDEATHTFYNGVGKV